MAPRRSRRIASQEPETDIGSYNLSPMRAARIAKKASAVTVTTTFDVAAAVERRLAGDRQFIYTLTGPQRKAMIDGITDRNTRLESRIDELEQTVTIVTSERDQAIAEAGRKRSLQQAAAQERIQRQMEQRRAAAAAFQAQQTVTQAPEQPTTAREPFTPSRSEPQPEEPEQQQPEQEPEQEPAQQQEREPEQEPEPARIEPATPHVTSTPASSEPQQEQETEWTITTTTSATPPASASSTSAVPVPAWRKLINNAAGLLSPFGRRAQAPQQSTPQIGDRKRPAPADEGWHTPKRARTEEQPKRVRIAEPETTATPETPIQKHITAKVPQSAPAAQKQASTSLGELTSATRKRPAPSEESTPKPAKTPHLFLGPSSKNPKVPTSLSTITEYSENSRLSMLSNSTPAGMGTPSRLPNKRRSIAEVRASRLSGLGTPGNQPYSWERSSTAATSTPRPAQPNADMRFEKLERMKKLQRELEELKQDEDIIEMESHKRKRVKVDNLVYIPHNRPGDSKGTFRVPDIDSDDEMEVDESVPERTNVFEEAARQEPEPEEVEAAAPAVEIMAPAAEAVAPAAAAEVVAPAASKWNFPSVGKRRPEHYCSPEDSERYRIKFRAGYIAWRIEQGLPAEW